MQEDNTTPTKKRVRWTTDVKDSNPRLFKQQRKVLSTKRLWEIISPHVSQGDWEGLDKKFQEKKIDETTLVKFFHKKGHHIFSTALLPNSTNFFTFILNYIPGKYAQEIFREDDYKILKHFLATQEILENNEMYTDKRKATRVQRLTYLLKIDPDGIKEAFEKYENEAPYNREAVKEELRAAQEALQAENAPDLSMK